MRQSYRYIYAQSLKLFHLLSCSIQTEARNDYVTVLLLYYKPSTGIRLARQLHFNLPHIQVHIYM